jgi:hypothetical protein
MITLRLALGVLAVAPLVLLVTSAHLPLGWGAITAVALFLGQLVGYWIWLERTSVLGEGMSIAGLALLVLLGPIGLPIVWLLYVTHSGE